MTVPVASKPQSHVRIHPTGSLDGFKSTMLTPVIGNEFVKGTANIVDDILRGPNADQRIRDLAVMTAERGVVFFRAQNSLTNNLQKELITKMGKLTVRPPDHRLHTHPIYMSDREFSDRDADISTIDSATLKKVWKVNSGTYLKRDTLWASGYEMYDRISKPYRTFLETLTATHVADGFHHASVAGRFDLYEKLRVSPLNVGVDLGAEHPIVRTNPITGWKSIYAVGSIWDNHSTFHCATFDFDGFGDRTGNRAVGVGEVPYFDPSSKSQREDLGIEDTLPPFHW
ncbi:hypothetical protein BDV39DRAFT_212203 [Aspergillus sergii]|uniref:Uncharacterized protein n=1 Tax=Aspergillus sergii TaxID=1034303 RepID=A0A5N6WLF4_9EURO|nr:hypothetical protein BDV39DRAFT_212203 [Aspergillus sergii]